MTCSDLVLNVLSKFLFNIISYKKKRYEKIGQSD